jgi:outer membrane protein assembly factor BamE
MQRLTVLVLLCVALGGCGIGGVRFGFPGVYRIDIQQGNIVTQEMIDQLKPGMTKRQVRFIMGTPLVVDTFEPERWDYVHTMAKKGEEAKEERVSLYFDKDVLVRISGDFAPASGAKAPTAEAAPAPAKAPEPD